MIKTTTQKADGSVKVTFAAPIPVRHGQRWVVRRRGCRARAKRPGKRQRRPARRL